MEVYLPHALLANGMCFVEAPGLGAASWGNTAAARSEVFVPHIDAAIVLVGAVSPISGEELALVEEVGRQVRDLIVVLNTRDKTSDEDRSIAKSFTGKVLEKRPLASRQPHLREVSAEERLENHGPERAWATATDRRVGDAGTRIRARSLGTHRRRTRPTAVERGTALAMKAKEIMPWSGRSRNPSGASGELRQTTEAQRSLRDVRYLFMAAEHRLSHTFLEQRKRFLAAALPIARAEFAGELKKSP